MRPVGIATVGQRYLLSNVGSFLQHYALREVLRSLGYSPFRIRRASEPSTFIQMLVRAVLNSMRIVYWWMIRLPNRRASIRQLWFPTRLTMAFMKDYQMLIGRLDERQFFGSETVGVRGSDQVFSLDDEIQWLSSIEEGNARVAYAASTDWCEHGNSPEWRDMISRRLRCFTAISVRENAGVSIVQSLAPLGIAVAHVADPVELLTKDEFQKVAHKKAVFRRPTLFVYLVNIHHIEDLNVAAYEEMASMLHCELRFFGIQGAERFIPRRYFVQLAPVRFLRALSDASFFITNSYHGSVFAILYHKQFLSVKQRCSWGTDQNARQSELMEMFGLRHLWVDCCVSVKSMYEKIVSSQDWLRVDCELDRYRQVSREWLRNVLENVQSGMY